MKLISLFPHPGALMMGYVFITEHNRVLLIDGGLDNMGGSDCEGYLFAELQRITGMEHPVIDAWFFTHPHSDHFSEFCRMVRDHLGEFTVNHFFFNFPCFDWCEKVMNAKDISRLRWFRESFNAYYHDPLAYANYHPPYREDTYDLRGLHVDFLRMPDENIHPNCVNNSSMVFRITAEGQRFLFLGDLGIEGGRQLAAMHGEELACDVCQMAHHGQKACDATVYDLAAPKLCLFPTAQWTHDNVGRDGPGTGHYELDKTLSYPTIAPAEKHFACIDGTRVYELPIVFGSEVEEK